MILVDTSVWIDFLEGGTHWSQERLKASILDGESIAYTDMVLLEILQGVRKREDRERIELDFEPFLLLESKRSTIRLAADIYQGLQRKGIRIRSSIDCLIAATAIETGAIVLHKDRDFDFIAQHYPLVMMEQ